MVTKQKSLPGSSLPLRNPQLTMHLLFDLVVLTLGMLTVLLYLSKEYYSFGELALLALSSVCLE